MYIQRIPSGYHVILRDEALHLKPAEAEKLVTSLLSEMPNIPDRLKLAWSIQTNPRGKIVRSFKYEKDEIVEYFRLEVYIPNVREHNIYVGPDNRTALGALLAGYEGYGDTIDITELVTDLVSKKLAEKEQNRAKVADTVMQKYGMSMKEIMRYVSKHKELPPEVKIND